MFLDLRIKRLDTAWIRRLEARPIFTVKMYALEDQINLIETRSTALLAQSRAMGHPGSLLYLVHLGTTHMATSYQLPTITSMFSYLGGHHVLAQISTRDRGLCLQNVGGTHSQCRSTRPADTSPDWLWQKGVVEKYLEDLPGIAWQTLSTANGNGEW